MAFLCDIQPYCGMQLAGDTMPIPPCTWKERKHAHSECALGGSQVSEASAAWLVHWVLLKGMLWVLGIPGAVPYLELAAYAGYAFVPVCISMLAGLALGAPPVPNRCA